MQKLRATSTRLIKMLIARVRYLKTQSRLVIRHPSITHKAKRLFCYVGTHLNQLGNSVLLNVLGGGGGGLNPSCCPNLVCQCFLMIGKSSSLNNLPFFLPEGVLHLLHLFCGGWACIDKLNWRNSGISTKEDFSHFWLKTLYIPAPVQGGYWVTSLLGLPGKPAWSLLYQGQVLGPTPGGVIPIWYQGRQEIIRTWARTWSPLHMWHSLLAPRGISLTTVTYGSAFTPGRR